MSVFDKLNAGDPGSVIVMFDRDTGWDTMGEASFEPVRQVAIDDDWSPETTRPRERAVAGLSGLHDRSCTDGRAMDPGGSDGIGGDPVWGVAAPGGDASSLTVGRSERRVSRR